MTTPLSRSSMIAAFVLAACVLVVPATAADDSGIRLLKDIAGPDAPPETVGTFGAAYALAHGGKILFSADDGVHGTELWITDGTASGTHLVKDIDPGPRPSSPYKFAAFGDKVIFRAEVEGLGAEPWITDGTAAGTTLLKDATPGPVGSGFLDFGVAGGKIFFGVRRDLEDPSGLWVSDGTTAGTRKVEAPALDSDRPRVDELVALGDKIVFIGRDMTHGPEPWISDGTVAGTRMIKDTWPGLGDVNGIQFMRSLGDQVIFYAKDPDSDHPMVWRTDGTTAGTYPLGVRSDNGKDDILGPAVYRGKLVFAGYRANEGFELWITDGTVAGTRLVKDIWPGAEDSFPNQMAVYRDKVYFAVDTPDAEELWVTEGTAASTRSVRKLLVRQPDDHGSAGAPPGTGVWENPTWLKVAAGRLYFSAQTTQAVGLRLWSTDGTPAGTTQVPAPAGLFLGTPVGVAGGRLVLGGWSADYGHELWVKDLGADVRSATLPRITGLRFVGSRLTSTVGTWSGGTATFSRQWLRNGVEIPGATGSTYLLRPADAGKIMAVRVTAHVPDGGPVPATSLRTGAVKFRSATSATARRTGRTVTLSVKVTTAGRASGLVRIKDGARAVRTVALTGGRARVVLRSQSLRKHRYTAVYVGSQTVAGSKGRTVVRIR